jgi:hypothetical protein
MLVPSLLMLVLIPSSSRLSCSSSCSLIVTPLLLRHLHLHLLRSIMLQPHTKIHKRPSMPVPTLRMCVRVRVCECGSVRRRRIGVFPVLQRVRSLVPPLRLSLSLSLFVRRPPFLDTAAHPSAHRRRRQRRRRPSPTTSTSYASVPHRRRRKRIDRLHRRDRSSTAAAAAAQGRKRDPPTEHRRQIQIPHLFVRRDTHVETHAHRPGRGRRRRRDRELGLDRRQVASVRIISLNAEGGGDRGRRGPSGEGRRFKEGRLEERRIRFGELHRSLIVLLVVAVVHLHAFHTHRIEPGTGTTAERLIPPIRIRAEHLRLDVKR